VCGGCHNFLRKSGEHGSHGGADESFQLSIFSFSPSYHQVSAGRGRKRKNESILASFLLENIKKTMLRWPKAATVTLIKRGREESNFCSRLATSFSAHQIMQWTRVHSEGFLQETKLTFQYHSEHFDVKLSNIHFQ